MKNVLLMICTAICAGASVAQAAPTFHCVGNQAGANVELDFYQGYGYDATYAYSKDGELVSSGYAKGGSYTLCGSRTNPCKMVTHTQYHVEDLHLILTASGNAESSVSFATVSIYGNGYGADQTESFQVQCQK